MMNVNCVNINLSVNHEEVEMKRMLQALFLLLLFASAAAAQIPNAGFENWTGNNPDGWATFNSPPYFEPITRSTDAHSGSAAARGEVVNSIVGAVSPILQSGPEAEGFPVSDRYGQVTLFYKFNPVGQDRLALNFILTKASNAVAVGASAIQTAAQSWTQIDVPFNYLTTEVPDTCILQIMIIGGEGSTYTLGSNFIVDDLSFSGAVAVDDERFKSLRFSLSQNYPNPFNPETNITFTIPEAGYTVLKIYDALGREAATLINGELAKGEYTKKFNAQGLPGGVYFAKLQSGSYSAVKKMMLLK